MERWIRLPFRVKRPILALGADMKGAFAIAKDDKAVLVDGFGDLADIDNFTRYEKAVTAQLKKLKVRPVIVACDMHPGYFSTRFAENFTQYAIRNTLYKIQHHEAHVASAIIDSRVKGKVIGVAFDGTGYGADGKVWGGEFFVGSLKKFIRAAHFDYTAMPGGDKAILQPWRMAASYLYKIKKYPARFKKQPLINMMIDKGINSPLSSSAGRLFDAVGSLVLARDVITGEAELPMEMERIAGCTDDKYAFSLKGGLSGRTIDVSKMIELVMKDLSGRVKAGLISAKFHNTMADIILKVSLELGRSYRTNKVLLTGGVFQNKYLSDKTKDLLNKKGLRVYRHSDIPTNDSGIPIGQIAIVRSRCV